MAVADSLEKQATDRRVALLAHPDLADAAATDGLHAGVQMLLPGESASAHRHTPAALRVGLEATDLVTTVDGEDVLLDPLDVVLNPPGTWHGHVDRGDAGAVWLDIVDLPLVSALGGVLFQPPGQPDNGSLLDPPGGVPTVVRYPWAEAETQLDAAEPIDGVRTHHYGNGSVLPTLAVSAHKVEEASTLRLPRRTAGAVLLVAAGRFGLVDDVLERFDVVALRSWTPAALTSRRGTGVAIVIDTSPAMRALGLYREEGSDT